MAKRRGGGRTHKWPEEFKQCCAQCDYLSFFHAGCSFRGHYHRILSISHRRHTHTHKKNRLGFAISMTQSHLEFPIDCAQWPRKGPCGERPPHLSEFDHIWMRGCRGRFHPSTRRGCKRGLETYYIGLLLQRRDLFVRIFHERVFKSKPTKARCVLSP